ncbi:hypothetical protein [Pantoea sp. CFSAN033090]|uniref:hypothetical protein n=1 Tax=Pantoea sp. CFSAN033090 TaxID=1690502 RepID=UPI0012E2ABE6|nr:hypothetical protein [Pantoea sp. CFSAN033090]
MSEDKKNLLSSHPGLTTGGLGAVITTLVPALVPDQNSLWRPVLYAAAPLVSAAITYFMAWFVSRHGLETPAEASYRNSLNRDLKSIDEQLKSPHLTDELRQELLADRALTVRQLVNIGKSIKVLPATEEPPKS